MLMKLTVSVIFIITDLAKRYLGLRNLSPHMLLSKPVPTDCRPTPELLHELRPGSHPMRVRQQHLVHR